MGWIRPATPGFIVTLVATGLLAAVSFCVPYLKSVFFLKASISVNNISGNITFGTLGYCLEFAGNTTCSKPSIGYELDINSLVGDNTPLKIPKVVVKWITYALFLHVIALIGAAGSAVFGLLAHVREMSMVCCSTFISGFAAVVAMFAFIFDLVLFYVAKARINAVGSAQMGNAIWLTLAAWILLFFSGCFYTVGRCCISSRSRVPGGGMGRKDAETAGPDKDYAADRLRLDAVKAEADRKAQQKQEIGLPAFSETQPLTGHVNGDHVYLDGDTNETQAYLPHPSQQVGYVPGPPGTRAVDELYGGNTYPPQDEGIHRAPSTYSSTPSAFASYGYTPSPPSPPLQPVLNYGAGSRLHGTSYHDQQFSSFSQYGPAPVHFPQPYLASNPSSFQPQDDHPSYSNGYDANLNSVPPSQQSSNTQPNAFFEANPPINTYIPFSQHPTRVPEDAPPGYNDPEISGTGWGRK